MRRSILIIFSLVICLGITGQALAASYAVAPFKINGASGYAYLEKAIPPMFGSRLFLAGTNEPIQNQDKLLSQKAIGDEKNAEIVRKQYDVDFLVYGSVTIIGENASLDVSVLGKNKSWKKSVQTNINDLFSGVQSISDSINREVFDRKIASSPNKNTNFTKTTPAVNTNTPNSQNYLNPELRYQEMGSQRARTKPLDFESYGFEIADFDGDGAVEIAVLGTTEINIYRFEGNQLTLISEYDIPHAYEPLRIRSLLYKGKTYLVFSAHEESSKSARGMIFSLVGNKLQKVTTTYSYLNVERIVPLGEPVLIGQKGDATRFIRGPVYQMNFDGKSIKQGRSLGLPKGANVFNFTWLPANNNDANNEGAHLIVIDDSDRMLTFDAKGNRLSKTEDFYASTGVGVRITRDITGFASVEGSTDLLYYYIPMRVIAADINNSGQYEAITSKPLSAAAILLNNYRNYSQGEIHSQVWDGIGMSLLWKTRPIKGTIVDIQIADPNNDGITDLVVNVNTSPGSLGLGKIKNTILLYPLDSSTMDSGTGDFVK